MKTVVALCLLAAICTVDAFGALDQLRYQLEQSKLTVNAKTANLERLDRNTQVDTKMKATDKYVEQMTNHNNYLNPTITDIRKEVEAAKAKGKAAQPCYDNAFAKLKEISNVARTDGGQCIKTAENSIQSELGSIQNLILTGRRLKTELDTVFPNCLGSQIETCVAIKLGTINVQVRSFESEANSAEYTAKSASNNVVLRADSCTRDVVSAARSRITETKLAAIKCVEAL